jgi:uncharacterized protein
MVETTVPDYVDARKIFAQRAHISGTVPLARFTRFCELLADCRGELKVSLQFGLDERHRRIVEGSIETSVSVVCQRCLEHTNVQLQESFKLGVVESEAQIERLPDDVDPWLTTDARLTLVDILEEQLILAMPIVSYHLEACSFVLGKTSEGTAERKTDSAVESDDNPFAVLKKLIIQDKQN